MLRKLIVFAITYDLASKAWRAYKNKKATPANAASAQGTPSRATRRAI